MNEHISQAEQTSFAMHPTEFKAIIKQLGFTQATFAAYLGQNVRTVNDWGAERPKNASKIKGTLRIGPPEHIVRILRLLERHHIPSAPASQSRDQAIGALSVAFASLLGTAISNDWTGPSIVAALSQAAGQHGIFIQVTGSPSCQADRTLVSRPSSSVSSHRQDQTD